jgi:hypothetical protein
MQTILTEARRSWPRLGRSGLILMALLLGLLLSGFKSSAALQPPVADVLRLGAWNIEWLGQPSRREEALPQNPEDIAKYLMHSGCQVVGVMEVSWNIDTAEGPGNLTLLEALRIIKERTDQEWKHVLFPKEASADRDQLCGVAWNASRVQRQDGPWSIPVFRPRAEAECWRRHPYATQFSAGPGKTDFTLIVVHMKSNRGGPEITGRTRDAEALSLVRALGAVQNRFKDEDLIIAGDSNCLKASERAVQRFIHGGFRHLNEADMTTWIKSREFPAAPFDRFFVPEQRPAFAQSQQHVLTTHHLGDEAAFRRLLSDHYLIYTELRVLPDDD